MTIYQEIRERDLTTVTANDIVRWACILGELCRPDLQRHPGSLGPSLGTQRCGEHLLGRAIALSTVKADEIEELCEVGPLALRFAWAHPGFREYRRYFRECEEVFILAHIISADSSPIPVAARDVPREDWRTRLWFVHAYCALQRAYAGGAASYAALASASSPWDLPLKQLITNLRDTSSAIDKAVADLQGVPPPEGRIRLYEYFRTRFAAKLGGWK